MPLLLICDQFYCGLDFYKRPNICTAIQRSSKMILPTLLLLVAMEAGAVDLESCAADLWRILKTNLTKHTLYLYQPNYSLNFVHALQNQTIYISKFEPNFYTGNLHVDSVLLSLGDVESLREYLYKFKYKDVKNDGDCVALVVCHLHVDLEDLLPLLWTFKFANVIVLDHLGDAYTYHPITAGSERPVYLGHCGAVSSFLLESKQLYFPNATLGVAGNYHEPKVTSTDYESDPGLEIAILRTLTKALCLKVEYSCDSCVTKRDFNGWSADDIACGGMYTLEMYPNDDYMYYIIQRRYAIVVPAPEPVEPWLRILYIFHVEVWVGLITAIILVGLVYRNTGDFTTLDLSLLFALSILVNSAWKPPTKIAGFFVGWSFAALLLTNAYTGLLVSFMFKDFRQLPMKNLEDLIQSGVTLGSYVYGPHQLTVEGVRKRCGIVSTECYKQLLEGKMALHDDIDRVAYFLRSYRNPPFYYVPPSQVGLGGEYSIFLVEKGLPFKYRLELYLRRLEEAGIVFWLQAYKWKDAVDEESGFANISMDHLYLIFGVYSVGLFVSAVAFLLEVLKSRRSGEVFDSSIALSRN